jgi:RNA polymerase sigma-70 factor (ECF subfamily)
MMMAQQTVGLSVSATSPGGLRPPVRVERDHALIEALRGREPGSAERLVETYGERAYRLAMRITRNPQDAEEIVQDALWTIMRKIDTFRGEAAFGSWLYRIVANAAYQRVRRDRHRRSEISLDEVLPMFHEDGEHAPMIVDWSSALNDPARQSELRRVLTSAMDALPEDYRTAIVLRDVEGFSTIEVAQTLGLSVANVKTRVHRGRLFLRKRLAEYASTGDALATQSA